MTIASSRINVTDVATVLEASQNPAYTTRGALLITNRSSNTVTVDVGGAGVTSGAGYRLAPGDAPLAMQLAAGEGVYAIAPAGQNVTLDVMQGGLV